MNFNYRFSIIPPGAITDARVTPRALQVLCLLGRHIDNGGWCSRSQVKMARELGCSRSAVQQACDLLIDTGWIETKRNGRGGTGPDSSGQPFAAFSYRVRLDRDDLPVEDDGEAPQPEKAAEPAPSGAPDPATESSEGGATIVAGGATMLAGGATMLAPLEGISSKGIFPEGERDARAREHERFAKWLAAFTLAWPTAASDSQTRIATAGRALSWPERDTALKKIPEFLGYLEKLKRKAIPSGWTYLEERRWTLLPQAPPSAPAPLTCDEGSAQWRIWQMLWRIARPREGIPGMWLSGQPPKRRLRIFTELPEPLAALADTEDWRTFAEGTPNFAAWRRWLAPFIGANWFQFGPSGAPRTLTVPVIDDWPWPPRKDGSVGESNANDGDTEEGT